MWKLVFAGDLVTGFEHQEAIDNLAKLLKLQPEEVGAQLFSGEPVVFKEVETEDEAQQWRIRFEDAGALLLVMPADGTIPTGWPFTGRLGYFEEPSTTSLGTRVPFIRQRNNAFTILALIVLGSIFISVLMAWFGRLLM